MDPASFYTGLVARLYGALRSSAPELSTYQDFIATHGEPALELGCGDGDPLLDLVASGLDVDGVDSSVDMLDRLRRSADDRQLAVTVYAQKMQELDLPRRYRSIFLAGPTFTVLPDDATALQCLSRIREHLAPDGTALIPLWVPSPTSEEDIGAFREADDPDGDGVIAVAVVDETYDAAERTRRSLLRYEHRHSDGDVEALEREWLIHWYDPAVFRDLARGGGLRVVDMRDAGGDDPAPDCDDFTVRLSR